MKKTIFVSLLILASLLSVGCGNNQTKTEEQAQAQMPSSSAASTTEKTVPDSIINHLHLCAA